MKGMDKIKIFSPDIFKKMSVKYIPMFRKRVTKNALDAKGNPLPPYSEGYKKLLKKDFRKKDGSRYKGYTGYPLTTGGSKISRRPFILRGKGITMTGLKYRKADSDSITIGWRDPDAQVVEGNEARGRDIISDIPDKEKKWIADFLASNVEEQYRKKVKDMKITVSL